MGESAQRSATMDLLAAAQGAAGRLTLFDGMLGDPAVGAFLDAVHAGVGGRDGPEREQAFHRFVGRLVRASLADAGPLTGLGDPGPGWGGPRRHRRAPAALHLDRWRAYVLERLLADENPFTLEAERCPPADLPADLLALAAHDLRCLQQLFAVDLATLATALGSPLPLAVPPGPVAAGRPVPSLPESGEESDIRWRLAVTTDWGACAAALAGHVWWAGAGIFGRYIAFRWDRTDRSENLPPGPGSAGRALVPIAEPDPVRLADLIGYEAERSVVLQNTARFVSGLPAHNLLLYGERGTGKSATVKAMLHEFAPRGLRMVELPRRLLGDLPDLLALLCRRGRPVVVFVDDLSFDAEETAFKELKTILEGTLAARPRNVLLYATSNRRHLIEERFADRRLVSAAAPGVWDSDDEVRPQDTLQEKLSLADRFGMTVIFASPDQEGYLQIVEGLAARRGLAVPRSELRRRALQWAAWHNGRSPRTAQQFIDELQGELGLTDRRS